MFKGRWCFIRHMYVGLYSSEFTDVASLMWLFLMCQLWHRMGGTLRPKGRYLNKSCLWLALDQSFGYSHCQQHLTCLSWYTSLCNLRLCKYPSYCHFHSMFMLLAVFQPWGWCWLTIQCFSAVRLVKYKIVFNNVQIDTPFVFRQISVVRSLCSETGRDTTDLEVRISTRLLYFYFYLYDVVIVWSVLVFYITTSFWLWISLCSFVGVFCLLGYHFSMGTVAILMSSG